MVSNFILLGLFLVMAGLFVRMAAAAVYTAYQLSRGSEPDAPQAFYDNSTLANFYQGQSGPGNRTLQKHEMPEPGTPFALPAHTEGRRCV